MKDCCSVQTGKKLEEAGWQDSWNEFAYPTIGELLERLPSGTNLHSTKDLGFWSASWHGFRCCDGIYEDACSTPQDALAYLWIAMKRDGKV